MSEDENVGIMKLKRGSISPLVIVVGDPARAKLVSELMKDAKCVGNNREFVTYTGNYKGVEVTVASHGVGGGGASMAFEELIQGGAKVLIRAGTCGSFIPEYKEGSLFVVSGAVRRDGVTDNLVYREYPAIAHHKVVSVLEDTIGNSVKYKTGLCLSEGCFYDGPLGNLNTFWQKSNVCCVEMECSVLFVIAQIRGVKAGAILNVDNYVFERLETKDNSYNPHREIVHKGTKRMCEIVLDAIIKLKEYCH